MAIFDKYKSEKRRKKEKEGLLVLYVKRSFTNLAKQVMLLSETITRGEPSDHRFQVNIQVSTKIFNHNTLFINSYSGPIG